MAELSVIDWAVWFVVGGSIAVSLAVCAWAWWRGWPWEDKP